MNDGKIEWMKHCNIYWSCGTKLPRKKIRDKYVNGAKDQRLFVQIILIIIIWAIGNFYSIAIIIIIIIIIIFIIITIIIIIIKCEVGI